MKININVIEQPSSNSFVLCADIDKDRLKEVKNVVIRGDFITKTRVNTTLQFGNSRQGVNFAIEGFKTDGVKEYSFFTHESSTCNYFKKSKKQGVEAYKEYVKEVVRVALTEYIRIDLDEVTVDLILPEFN